MIVLRTSNAIFEKTDMIFNGHNISSLVFIEDIRRPFISPLSNTLLDVGEVGFIHKRVKPQPKTIEVDVRIIENDRKRAGRVKEILASLLVTDTPKRLDLRDTERFDFAILDGDMSFERYRNTGFITLNFVNPSGLSYGKYKKSIIKENSLFNLGTAKIQPIIRVIPKKTNQIVIRNLTAGQHLEIRGNYTNSDEIVFGEYGENNNYLEKVLINKRLEMMPLTIDSDFFHLELGRNDFEIIGAEEVSMEYWEAFI